MPPVLLNVAIPVIRSPRKVPSPMRINYPEGPLPIKPSQHAPRNARIIRRIAEPDRVAYQLDVGGVQIDDVGIDEVLDYVSAFDLEQFENNEFEDMIAAMEVARREEEAEEERRRQRRKERAKSKGKVIFEEVSSNESSADGDDDEMEGSGRQARARPNYSNFYKLPKGQYQEPDQRRRRRKRNKVTGELMPLSDDDDDMEVEFEAPAPRASRPPGAPIEDIPKRRRRKRDKITGKLLPLDPLPQEEDASRSASESVREPIRPPARAPAEMNALGPPEKRPRRRRHPLTNELMPLGYRYDDKTGQVVKIEQDAPKPPSLHRLSISQEHDQKRLKLISGSSSPSSTPAVPKKEPTQPAKFQGIDLTADSSESEESEQNADRNRTPAKAAVSEKPPILNPSQTPSRLAPPSMRSESSSEPITLASFLKASAGPKSGSASSDDDTSSSAAKLPQSATSNKTSIMNPVANPVEESDEDEEDFFVEAILGHKLSDPRTHGAGAGNKPVMLYSVKWEGHDKPTWEPYESFTDPSIVVEYRKHVGLDKGKGPAMPTPGKASVSKPPPKTSLVPPKFVSKAVSEESEDDDEDDDDDGYEVEKILAHHMSDPRTHPGKPAVMLYQVKWVGWKDPTWEPRDSFTDLSIVDAYERKVGLRADIDDDSDGMEF